MTPIPPAGGDTGEGQGPDAAQEPTTAADGSVVVARGVRIPVRNVWLLLLYA